MRSLAFVSNQTADAVKSGDIQKSSALVLVFIPPHGTPSSPQFGGGERSCQFWCCPISFLLVPGSCVASSHCRSCLAPRPGRAWQCGIS